MEKNDTQSKYIISLAVFGLIFVVVFALAAVFYDRWVEDKDATFDEKQTDEKDYFFDSHGIKFEKELGYPIVENFDVEDTDTQIVDCRTYSQNLIESTNSKGDVCYAVQIALDDGYVVITTGSVFYQDEVISGISLVEEGEIVRYDPSSFINIPLERHYVDSFPINFNGLEVKYDTGHNYIFYKGLMYKWANKYAITIKGDVDDDVLKVLEQVEFE